MTYIWKHAFLRMKVFQKLKAIDSLGRASLFTNKNKGRLGPLTFFTGSYRIPCVILPSVIRPALFVPNNQVSLLYFLCIDEAIPLECMSRCFGVTPCYRYATLEHKWWKRVIFELVFNARQIRRNRAFGSLTLTRTKRKKMSEGRKLVLLSQPSQGASARWVESRKSFDRSTNIVFTHFNNVV